jgi:hypothetical protein
MILRYLCGRDNSQLIAYQPDNEIEIDEMYVVRKLSDESFLKDSKKTSDSIKHIQLKAWW